MHSGTNISLWSEVTKTELGKDLDGDSTILWGYFTAAKNEALHKIRGNLKKGQVLKQYFKTPERK